MAPTPFGSALSASVDMKAEGATSCGADPWDLAKCWNLRVPESNEKVPGFGATGSGADPLQFGSISPGADMP